MSGIDWAVAAAPLLPDPNDSGDRHVVRPVPGGDLVVVADGIGHGPEAAAAARLAIGIAERSGRESPIALLRKCHEELHATRGAVMSVAFFDHTDRTMTWSGVGNVEGILLRANSRPGPRREVLLSRGGVIGHELPALTAMVHGIDAGDTLAFATDGVRLGFEVDLNEKVPLQALADLILARHRTGTDDALVLIARYRGDGA